MQSNDCTSLDGDLQQTVTQTLSAIHAAPALLLQMFGVRFGCTPVLDNNELQEER